MIDSSLRVLPFGIDLYRVPKVERAFLLKPHLGKACKAVNKNFSDIEAALYKDVPGPIYNTTFDWNKEMPFNKGKFLKAERYLPESVMKKKERQTPSPAQYKVLESWKSFSPHTKGNFKQ